MNLKKYIAELNKQYQTGIAREHSYRPALQQLLSTYLPTLTVTNEPTRIKCGAPDFILTDTANGQPVCFVEAKDIDDNDLDGKRQHSEQFSRYKSSLDNIVFTDYLDFHLYEKGILTNCVRIAQLHNGKIKAIKSEEVHFEALMNHLSHIIPQKITSTEKLAQQMAVKARMLAETIKNTFLDNSCDNQQLQCQFKAFKQILIHDISPESFADIYAQTIAYGMFAARLHDKTPNTFSRQEAATLIPKTNPFLRQIFQSIAGFDLDERISWIVDDLATTFRHTDIRHIMKAYGKEGNDPMIHFYENFLSQYDPKLRRSKGVWYTPKAVVNFIVRATDQILQDDFDLQMGLADYSMTSYDHAIEQSYDKRTTDGKKHGKKKMHRVQILDPATGTGTFLAETVRLIYNRFNNMQGAWQSYVEEHLLPRLNGFELLMASYAIAHLKLDMLLQHTGYEHQKDIRIEDFPDQHT